MKKSIIIFSVFIAFGIGNKGIKIDLGIKPIIKDVTFVTVNTPKAVKAVVKATVKIVK